MTWCLSWWTPSGAGEVLMGTAFWAGVAGLGVWGWRRLRAARATTLTNPTDGDRHQAGSSMDDAPRPGAGIGSTR